MYHKTKNENVRRGDFLSLFTSAGRFKKYILCILVGIPVWYVISQLAVQSEKYATDALGITEKVTGGKSVMFHYIGASIGSLLFGFISERLRSRKKALLIAVGSLIVFCIGYFMCSGVSANVFYVLVGATGLSMGGLWAVFMANASEQFGTNVRATVTTTAPNFVRGTTEVVRIAITVLLPSFGLWKASVVVGSVCMVLSLIAIIATKETYGKDLDYNE
jgi:MFS family permease